MRLARQPGTVACGAISLVLVVVIGLSIAFELGFDRRDPIAFGVIKVVAIQMTSDDAFNHLTPLAAWATAASWLVLAVGGRWRPEPDWIDRAGRVIGITWIAAIPFYVLRIVSRL